MSQTPSIGVVNSTGLATGVTTGAFNAAAALNGVTGTFQLTVTSAVLQSITITPANQIIVNLPGNTLQFTATGNYSDGTTQNITDSVQWSLGGVDVGTKSQTGSFSSVAIGLGTVTATSGSISGSTDLTVVSL
ncbi:MAG TPA: Ig-like domain-containing protein [Terracidiphilus sp.]